MSHFLTNFQGCVLIVTHDRYFMDKMVDHLFVFEGAGVLRDFPGNYTEYRDKKELEDKAASKLGQAVVSEKEVVVAKVDTSTTLSVTKEVATPKKKLSFKEKLEYDQLEKEIANLETEKAKITSLLNAGSDNHEDVMKWSEEVGVIISKLDEKSFRWLELGESV